MQSLSNWCALSLVVLFASCGAQKLETQTPFNLGNIISKTFVGGIQSSGSGTEIHIPVTDLNTSSCQLTKLYYKERVADLTPIIEGEKYVARFYKLQKPDMQMHKDAQKEGGNTAPALQKVKSPITIGENQALLEYKDQGKTKYVLLETIKAKGHIAYPSAPSGRPMKDH